MIGFSIDSFIEETKIRIGRANKKDNKTLQFEQLKSIIQKIKKINKDCIIKINTVVLKENYQEFMFDTIKYLGVNKWKILKAKRFKVDEFDNTKYIPMKDEYNQFLQNNLNTTIWDFNNSIVLNKDGIEIVIEPSLESSYIFIDSNGYLLDNRQDKHTKIIDFKTEYKPNILEEDFLDLERYNSRYK